MSLERIKRLAQEGTALLWGSTVPCVGSEEAHLISDPSFNKLIEILDKIEKEANEQPYRFHNHK